MRARDLTLVVFSIGAAVQPSAFADDVARGWYALPTYHQTHLDNANVKFRSPTVQVNDSINFGDDTHAGYAVGYAFDGPYRVDVTYMTHSSDIKGKGTIFEGETLDVDTVVAAVWREFDIGHRFAPYVGAGIGYASLKSGGLDANEYLGQLGAGIEWSFARRWALDVGYLYQMTPSDPELSGSGAKLTTQYSAQSAHLGIRYTFWPR